MIDRFPGKFVALNLFNERFGDLVSVRAEITEFEKSIIESTYELLWLDMVDGPGRAWEQTLRAAFSIIDKGGLSEPELVWKSYIEIVNQIVPAFHKTFGKRREAKEAKDDDKLIEAQLIFYKSIYEGLLPVILAPIVYAFGLLNDPNERAFTQREDGRISLSAIGKMEKWVRPPENRLAVGLNAHVRNAYSHEYYRILDHGRVVMHDVNPRSGKISWGPETWTVQQLSEFCDQVWVNSLAINCALALYGVNNRKVATARNWGIPKDLPPLRERDLERTLDEFADNASFDLKEFSQSDNELRLILKIHWRGIDQDEEVCMGGEGWARRFKMPVKYVETRIVEQVTGFLQKTAQFLDDIQNIHVTVNGLSNEQLGELRTTKGVIEQLRGPKTQDISEARRQFELDTLGESTMYVRLKGPPVEV